MTSTFEKQSQLYRHPVFEGLSDKELVTVYNIANVKKINTGSVLLKGGDADPATYLILEGSAQILKKVKGQDRQIAAVRQGDWLLSASFTKDRTRTASAIALEPLTAFVLDESACNALPSEIQLVIYKNLNSLSAQRIHDLCIEQTGLSESNRCLTSHVANLVKARSDEYASSEMIQSLLKGIPRLPVYTNKIAMLLFDENVSARDVAKVARLDPSLVSNVLKSVNSAYYGLLHKVSDFQHALLLLGFNQVYQLIIGTGVRSTMPKTPEFRELQFHSMMVSFISFEIAQLCNMKRAVSNSTIGLLHDIGKSVILLLKNRYPKMTLLVDMLDHTKIGSLLLKEWNIPDIVCQSLEYQGYPELLPPEEIPAEYRKDVAVLYVAHLCYDYLQGKSEHELTTAFISEYMDALGFSEGTISELVRKKVLPCLNKQLNNFPQDVRHFLTKSADHVVEKAKLDILDT